MQFGIHNLAREQRVTGEILAGKYALFVVLLRLMANDNGYFVADIDARVIVIVIFRRGNPVPPKDDRSTGFPVAIEVLAAEVCALFQLVDCSPARNVSVSPLLRAGSRGHLKIVKITPSQRLEPSFRELRRDVVCRLVNSGGPVSRPFNRVRPGI
jgi:hypothetical protein